MGEDDMNVLLTGHTGFVGAALSRILLDFGHTISGISKSAGFDLNEFDVINRLPLSNMVVHLAGLVGVEESWKCPGKFIKANCDTTISIAEYARVNKVPVIFLSSYMYGTPAYLPIDENHPVSYNNPYAYSKKLSEDILYSYYKLFGINVAVLRPMNIYGNGMGNGSILDLIINQANSGDDIILRDLSPKRDYLHIDDLCNAICNVVNQPVLDGFNIFNLGYGVSYSVAEIIDEIGFVLGRDFRVKATGEVRINEILDCYADISKFSAQFSWKPNINLRDGLVKTIKNS